MADVSAMIDRFVAHRDSSYDALMDFSDKGTELDAIPNVKDRVSYAVGNILLAHQFEFDQARHLP